MKVKHLIMLVGLLAAVTILQGCMARVEISLKDITVGEDITDDVKIEQKDSKTDQINAKTEQIRAKNEQPDEFEVEINKTPLEGGLIAKGNYKNGNFIPPATIIFKVRTWEKDRDCLWNIAKEVYGDPLKWPNIYQFNDNIIDDPDLIYPGQEFRIP